MRIARPPKPGEPFRRKRSPPRQATRLLLASLVAGLVFIAILAIVFIPRLLEQGGQTPAAILTLRIDTQAAPRIVVADATLLLNRASFRADLTFDGDVILGSLGYGLVDGAAALSFVDSNEDGNVGPGDYFSIEASLDGRYRFEVYQAGNPARLVGLLEWTGALS